MLLLLLLVVCYQVAKQEGEFVADLLLNNAFDPEIGTVNLDPAQKPFK